MAESQRERRQRERRATEKAKADARRAEEQARLEASKADTARAQADASKAGADAEVAKAKAEEIRATSEAARIKAAEKQRDDEAASKSSERVFETSTQVATYAGGVALGVVQAKKLEANFKAGVAQKNAQLAEVAKKVKPIVTKLTAVPAGKEHAAARKVPTAQLKATVTAADKAGITRMGRGNAGLATAGSLLAMSLVSRVVASNTENETVKTVINATATGEQVAAAVVIAKDLAARASPSAVVDTAALASVEEARALSGVKATVKKSAKAALKKVALKAIAPVAAVLAASSMFRSSANAGDSTVVSGVKAVAAGVDSIATAGILTEMVTSPTVQAAVETQRAQPRGARGSAPVVSETMKGVGLAAPAPTAYLNSEAESKAATIVPPMAPASQPPLTAMPQSDGRTKGYQRVTRSGLVINVGGYDTPTR